MTIMLSGQTVLFGPGADKYPKVGSVSKDENVKLLWTEGGYAYIEYIISETSQKKRGYVTQSSVKDTGVSDKTFAKTGMQAKASTDTLCGPDSKLYPAAGSINSGEAVLKTEYTENDFAFIEYNIEDGMKKRAYVKNDALAPAPAAAAPPLQNGSLEGLVGKVLANLSGSCYKSNNIYAQAGYSGQCTWYCWGRALEKTGKRLSFKGPNNGGQWFDNIVTNNITKRPASQGPVSNCIASTSGSSHTGHVMYIEKVDGDTVYYTESNVGGVNGSLKKATKSTFMGKRTVYGYIVL